MSEENENENKPEIENNAAQEVAPAVETAPETAPDESVEQKTITSAAPSEMTEQTRPMLQTRRFPGWARVTVLVGLVGALYWLWPTIFPATTPAPVILATATPTATQSLAVLIATATPVATATESTSAETSDAANEVEATRLPEIDIAALLSSTVPVIELPTLPAAIASNPLPAVVAEGGKPVIIAALAAQQPLAAGALSLDRFLRSGPRILPAIGYVPSAVEAAALRKVPPTPTPIPILLAPGRSWANFVPAPSAENDHFWVERPFAPSISVQLAAPSYQFGSTAGGRYRVHHGMDIGNPFGTPVLAATTGEVVHAGPDNPEVLGPYNNFYGNTVVIRLDRKLAIAGGGLDVYLLYGHLSQVTVAIGQRVLPSDVIGMVGMTGIAIGPHLHVEMRVGANTYTQSVNPYLWVRPLEGTGAVAVRLLTADGRTWPTARLTLARFSDGRAVWGRVLEIYPDNESVNPNPAWGENGAMESVPAGNYYIYGLVNGERVAAELSVNPGQTTFVELRTVQ